MSETNKGFINEQSLSDNLFTNLLSEKVEKHFRHKEIVEFKNVLDDYTIEMIMKELKEKEWVPVGIDGILKNYNKEDAIGSYRLSIYNESLSRILWNKLKSSFKTEQISEYASVENDSCLTWEPIGINPLFRLIHYKENGYLIPHYDASYIKDKNIRTLKSLIIYLTTNEDGQTQFIADNQENLKTVERDFSDRFFVPDKRDIYLKVNPVKGNALCFNHRLLHNSEFAKEAKTIIRTDILYKKASKNG